MPEFPVELVPVEGGYYAVHLVGCDHPERETVPPGRPARRRFPATSVADAVARLYREGTVGVTAPDRFVRRDCISNLPMTDPTPVPWDTLHAVYVKQAAAYLWMCAAAALRRSQEATEELTLGSREQDGKILPGWLPQASDLRTSVRAAHEARLWAVCVDGFTKEPSSEADASRVVTQTEKALRDAMEKALDHDTGHADAVDALFAQIEKQAATRFMRSTRSCLAKVHAHRATRDAVA
ncbi:hypothetical protein AB0M39_40130 [Streptomyces sp. NPDC051907]|uniref:hypothetical protein n=1 Tax=Streptomyces sp. NPDC051907 TaxID=3155284 RepID=UPI00341CEE9B